MREGIQVGETCGHKVLSSRSSSAYSFAHVVRNAVIWVGVFASSGRKPPLLSLGLSSSVDGKTKCSTPLMVSFTALSTK